MALTEVDGLVSVMSTWLLDSSGGSSVRALIDGRLHLLQKLINVHQIILGSQVWHRWKSVLMLWHGASMTSMASMAFNRNHCGSSRNVVGESASGDGNALELHKTLTHLGIRTRVNLAALGITEEVIQDIETTLSVVIGGMLTEISSMADGIVYRTVRGLLLRGVIGVVCVVRGAILGSRARVHLRGMIIVAIGGSYKILQVSKHYTPRSEMSMCKEQVVKLALPTFSLPISTILSMLLGRS